MCVSRQPAKGGHVQLQMAADPWHSALANSIVCWRTKAVHTNSTVCWRTLRVVAQLRVDTVGAVHYNTVGAVHYTTVGAVHCNTVGAVHYSTGQGTL